MALAGACALLTSCLTLGAWGFDYRVDDGDDEPSWCWSRQSYDAGKMAWWQRVLLTPLTLAVDCLTWPLQCWLFKDDEDDTCVHGAHHAGPGPGGNNGGLAGAFFRGSVQLHRFDSHGSERLSQALEILRIRRQHAVVSCGG